MQRVRDDGPWSLFCPSRYPQLQKLYGDEFDSLYRTLEHDPHSAVRVVRAKQLWDLILECQIETGGPFLLYKDHVNKKSNQMNVGTICSSNLCTEIVEYSDENETAVCNLASIALSRFVRNGSFDHPHLHSIVKQVTLNLNRVIDANLYGSTPWHSL